METRREANEKVNSRKYANKALWLALLIPLVLMPWSVSQTLVDACANICSYSEYSMLADIAKYFFLALAFGLTLWMAYAISWAYDHKENLSRIIPAFIIASTLSAVVLSGFVSEIVESLIVRIMY